MFMKSRHLAPFFMAGLLALAPLGCKKEQAQDKQVTDMTEKARQVDANQQTVGKLGAEQRLKLKEAGMNDVRPSTETLQLTDEQRKMLEERIKNEKNSNYQALLQEIIDKDKQITKLNEDIEKLRKDLPKPHLVKVNESHFGLAMRFLKSKGLGEKEAKRLIDRVNIAEELAPGMEVYHFYNNGVYGTFVTQGRASVSPNELAQQSRARITGERDNARAQAEKVQEEIHDLLLQKEKIESDLAGLRQEKEKLIDEMNKLSATNEAQKAKLNSLHYHVGERNKLKEQGSIVIPVFARDRFGEKLQSSIFDKDLDLRKADSVTINANEVGVKAIGKINVVPGSLEKDKHYTITIAPDKQSATIKLLKLERFRNENVIFAVSE